MGNKVSMAANIWLILASDKDAQLRCALGTSTVARLTIIIAMPKCQAYQTEFLFAVDYAPATIARPRRGIRNNGYVYSKKQEQEKPFEKRDSINHIRNVFKMQSITHQLELIS